MTSAASADASAGALAVLLEVAVAGVPRVRFSPRRR
jgi:hypothetical protein